MVSCKLIMSLLFCFFLWLCICFSSHLGCLFFSLSFYLLLSQKQALQLAPAKSFSWYVWLDKEHSCVLLLILSLVWYYSSHFVIAETRMCCRLMNVPPNPKETPCYNVKVARCWYCQSSTGQWALLVWFLINSLSHVGVLLNLSNLGHHLFLYARYVHSRVPNTS